MDRKMVSVRTHCSGGNRSPVLLFTRHATRNHINEQVLSYVLECANAARMDAICEEKARLGLCDVDRSLLDTCKLSCTRCGPLPDNVTGTKVV